MLHSISTNNIIPCIFDVACCSLTYSSGQYWYMFCSYVMKRKPRLHDGIVTIDIGKNRLVEIPRSASGSEAPDDGFTRIQLIASARNATITSKKKLRAFACELRMRIWHV